MGRHYVPQEYLRGFTDPLFPNALWQFDKEKQAFSAGPASIAKIAQERWFYDDDTERMLHELVELPGNRVLRKLRSRGLHLANEERAALSVYIATMLKRVPRHRMKGVKMAPLALAEVCSDLRDQIRAARDSGEISHATAERRMVETDDAEAKLSKEMPINVRNQIESPWPTETMIDLVYGMNWRFVRADGNQYFVASDNPAFFFRCYGLGTEYSELTFPVSAELAIFGSWTPVAKDIRILCGTQFVKEANRRLIAEATRFVFSRSKANWVSTVAAKKRPHLNRIQW